MGRRQLVEIGDKTFNSQAEAREHFRAILYKYALNQSVDKADECFLILALQRHPESATKIGPRVKRFEVRSADYGTRCFWVVRVDDTSNGSHSRSAIDLFDNLQLPNRKVHANENNIPGNSANP
ncbi:DCL family protein [Rhizobium phaseoli]|uniref:DCL family protein n=1 Tax=Rhizobium phaseoli TaxID=396 RepID=UPI001FEFEB62|nr:DCL family protein [Rhizobium phaseoli]